MSLIILFSEVCLIVVTMLQLQLLHSTASNLSNLSHSQEILKSWRSELLPNSAAHPRLTNQYPEDRTQDQCRAMPPSPLQAAYTDAAQCADEPRPHPCIQHALRPITTHEDMSWTARLYCSKEGTQLPSSTCTVYSVICSDEWLAVASCCIEPCSTMATGHEHIR